MSKQAAAALQARLGRCIELDASRQPFAPQDCFVACTNNNPVRAEDGTVFWPNLRKVHFRERDHMSMPITLLPPAMQKAGDKPATVVVYAPANAAASAGVGTELQLAAGEQAPPPGWATTFVLQGCVLGVKDKPVASEQMTKPCMQLRKPGLRTALAPLLEVEGRAPWWFVCGRWEPGAAAAAGVLALYVLPNTMIVQKAASSSGDSPGPAANTNGMGSQQEEERFGDTGEAAGEGGEVPLGSPLLAEGSEEEEEEEEEGEGYGEDEEEEEDEDEEMADLEDIEDLEEVEEEEVLPKGRCYGKRPAGGNGTNHLQQPSQGTSVTEEAVAGDGDKVEEEQEQREEQTPLPRHKKMRVEDSAFKLRATGTPPSHPAAPAGPSAALAAGGAAAGAGAGANGALAGGGSNPAALPLAEQWAAEQAWVIGLLGKLQLPLPQGELLALAARLLDPRPQPLQDFLAVEVCQLAMAAAHPHHLGQLFKALAAGTAPDHPLLGVAEEYRTTVEKAAGNGGPAAALQLLPEAPAGYPEERQAVTQFLKRGLADNSVAAAAAVVAAQALLPYGGTNRLVYPLVRAAAASGGIGAAVLVLHMAHAAHNRWHAPAQPAPEAVTP